MIKMFSKKMKNEKGFTLVELIVVVAILGILAAIAVPRFSGTQERAQAKAHSANIQTLTSAAQIAVAEHGAPATEVVWDSTEAKKELEKYGWGDYLDSWPTNPTGGDAYTVTIEAKTGEVKVAPEAIPAE